MAHVSRLRDRLVSGVLSGIPGARLTGHPTERMPNSASFTIEGADGESMLLNLDRYPLPDGAQPELQALK